MEVRGNNLGVSLSKFNKSSYNKFIPNQKISKRQGGQVMQASAGKHSQVVLSKHKSSKVKGNVFSNNQSQLVIKPQSSELVPMVIRETPEPIMNRKQMPKTETHEPRKESKLNHSNISSHLKAV